jgi:Tfp pilus assembly protein PilN
MVKKSIGIDMSRFHLRAVQIAQTPKGPRIEKAFGKLTRRSTDSVVELLRALTGRHGFDRRAEVTVCLPHHAVFFADVEVDEATLQALGAGDLTHLRDDLPIPAEKAIVQICSTRRLPNGRYSALLATTSTDLLAEELALFGEGKIRVTRIETSITAAHATVRVNHPESNEGLAILLVVDEAVLSLAVVQNGNLIMVRNIPLRIPHDSDIDSVSGPVTDLLGRELEITWRKLFGIEAQADVPVFLIAPDPILESLSATIQGEIGCRTVPVDAGSQVELDPHVQWTSPLCVAEGLALRRLLPHGAAHIDFLRAHAAQRQPTLNARKELTVCGGLLATMAAIWIGGMFLHRSGLESQYAQLTTQIQEVFRHTLPGEKCVSPTAQLQQKLDSLRDGDGIPASFRSGTRTPLEILTALSAPHPADGSVEFDDVLIAGDAVRVIGTCRSFAVLAEWQRTLQESSGFEIVEKPNPARDTKTDRVQFSLSLSTRKTVP